MSWKLIRSVQEKTDVRLVMPFGTLVAPGHVVSVGRDGKLALEGTCRSLLGLDAGPPSKGVAGDIVQSHGEGTTVEFRAAGEASTLFPDLPSATARFDVSFMTAESWLLALTGRHIHALEELNRFRAPILDAYKRKVWKPDWVLVKSVATAERMTLIAAETRDTNVTLALSAGVVATEALHVKLTTGVSILGWKQSALRWITNEPGVVGFSGRRVRDPIWRRPDLGDLSATPDVADPLAAADEEFWEDADDL